MQREINKIQRPLSMSAAQERQFEVAAYLVQV